MLKKTDPFKTPSPSPNRRNISKAIVHASIRDDTIAVLRLQNERLAKERDELAKTLESIVSLASRKPPMTDPTDTRDREWSPSPPSTPRPSKKVKIHQRLFE